VKNSRHLSLHRFVRRAWCDGWRDRRADTLAWRYL